MEKEITNIKCEYCEAEVTPDIHFGMRWRPKEGTTFIDNNICLSWSCPHHGAVEAILNRKRYATPADLFKNIIIMNKSVSTKRD